MSKSRTGVTYYESDKRELSFALRLGGTNEFVSKIDPNDPKCFPPGSIETVSGWGNQSALYFDTLEDAVFAGELAWHAEGCHINVEVAHAK